MGHQERFAPPRLRDRCAFREGTFGGTRANGRDAPKADHRPAAPSLRIGEKIASYDGSFPVPIFSAASRTQRLKERHRSQ
jgi:hypothetical protein